MLTGLIGSELRGLKKTDLVGDTLRIRRKINNKGKLINKLKSKYRLRDIPVTKATRQRLEMAMAKSSTEFVFCMKDGSPFSYNKFYKQIWCKAVKLGPSRRLCNAPHAGSVGSRGGDGTNPADQHYRARRQRDDFPGVRQLPHGLSGGTPEILEYYGHDFLTDEEWRMVTPGGLLDEKLAV